MPENELGCGADGARERISKIHEEGGMSTKDDALIEKMARAVDPDLFGDKIAKWESDRESVRRDMRAALAVARMATLEEALREILSASEGKTNDVAYGMHEAGRVVVSLATQEQHDG